MAAGISGGSPLPAEDGCGWRWPALSVFKSTRCRPRKARASNWQTAMSAKRSCCATSRRPSSCASMRRGRKTAAGILWRRLLRRPHQRESPDPSRRQQHRKRHPRRRERRDRAVRSRLGGRRRLRYRPLHRGGGTLRAGAGERESHPRLGRFHQPRPDVHGRLSLLTISSRPTRCHPGRDCRWLFHAAPRSLCTRCPRMLPRARPPRRRRPENRTRRSACLPRWSPS